MTPKSPLPLCSNVPTNIHLIDLLNSQVLCGVLHIDPLLQEQLEAVPVNVMLLDHPVQDVDCGGNGLGFLVGPVDRGQGLKNVGDGQYEFGDGEGLARQLARIS
mgnify:CR=1 FL=1